MSGIFSHKYYNDLLISFLQEKYHIMYETPLSATYVPCGAPAGKDYMHSYACVI